MEIRVVAIETFLDIYDNKIYNLGKLFERNTNKLFQKLLHFKRTTGVEDHCGKIYCTRCTTQRY